jgi:hypothetical protein
VPMRWRTPRCTRALFVPVSLRSCARTKRSTRCGGEPGLMRKPPVRGVVREEDDLGKVWRGTAAHRRTSERDVGVVPRRGGADPAVVPVVRCLGGQAHDRGLGPELVVEGPDGAVVRAGECAQARVQRQRAVPDLLRDRLEQDQRRRERGGLEQVHLRRVSINITAEGRDPPGRGRRSHQARQSARPGRARGPGRRRRPGARRARGGLGRACSRRSRTRRRRAGSARGGLPARDQRHAQPARAGLGPLTTLPRAVFLKNLRWVTTASSAGRLRIVISTMAMTDAAGVAERVAEIARVKSRRRLWIR